MWTRETYDVFIKALKITKGTFVIENHNGDYGWLAGAYFVL